MRAKLFKVAVLAALPLALVACGQTKLLGKQLPDETAVIDGPSLILPPDFALRPPRDGGDYESVLRAQKTAEAQALITGVSGTVVSGTAAAPVPAAEAWLVDQVHSTAGAAQPNIREKLATDAAGGADAQAEAAAKRKQGLFGRWFGGSAAE